MRPSAADCFCTLNTAWITVAKEPYDIFFSHTWNDKPFLCHLYYILSKAGYKVWYDQNNMGHDLSKSMSAGIEKSKAVVVCANKNYQNRPNCMYELKEARRLHKTVFVLLVDPDEKIFEWATDDMKDLCRVRTTMFHGVGNYSKYDWSLNAGVSNESSPILDALTKDMAPFTKLLHDAHCIPSFGTESLDPEAMMRVESERIKEEEKAALVNQLAIEEEKRQLAEVARVEKERAENEARIQKQKEDLLKQTNEYKESFNKILVEKYECQLNEKYWDKGYAANEMYLLHLTADERATCCFIENYDDMNKLARIRYYHIFIYLRFFSFFNLFYVYIYRIMYSCCYYIMLLPFPANVDLDYLVCTPAEVSVVCCFAPAILMCMWSDAGLSETADSDDEYRLRRCCFCLMCFGCSLMSELIPAVVCCPFFLCCNIIPHRLKRTVAFMEVTKLMKTVYSEELL